MSDERCPVSYRLLGHVTNDLTPAGKILGGSVTYSGLTAAAMGAEVGIVTACGADVDLQPLMNIDLITLPSEQSTTFRNIETKQGRAQKIFGRARTLTFDMLPADWYQADVVQLAPVADEIELESLHGISSESIVMTPQGWLRGWHENGVVFKKPWHAMREALSAARAIVCSIEDLDNDVAAAHELAQTTSVLVVTRSKHGATLFVEGKASEIEGLQVEYLDDTGSGDIFAAVFFVELKSGIDAYQAALRANYLAACSVTRRWLDSIPTQTEIQHARGSL